MKKFFHLIFAFIMLFLNPLIVNGRGFHHSHSIHHASHSWHHSHSWSRNKPHSVVRENRHLSPMKNRPVSVVRHHYGANPLLLYCLIPSLANRHKNDTYDVDGVEMRLCPKCQKRLIKKNRFYCSQCK